MHGVVVFRNGAVHPVKICKQAVVGLDDPAKKRQECNRFIAKRDDVQNRAEIQKTPVVRFQKPTRHNVISMKSRKAHATAIISFAKAWRLGPDVLEWKRFLKKSHGIRLDGKPFKL